MYALKIGGSALSNKKTGESFVPKVAKIVASEIPRGTAIAIAHGAGYVGHNECRIRGITPEKTAAGMEFDYDDALKIAATVRGAIEDAMTTPILTELRLAGHLVKQVPISEIARTTADGVIYYELSNVVKWAGTGVIPLLHSDVVVTRQRIYIVSMDEVVKEIANKMGRGTTCIYGTDVPGIIDQETQKVIPFLQKNNLSEVKLAPAAEVDVSGGPQRKIDEIMDIAPGIPIRVISLREEGNLAAAIRNDSAGTLII